MVIRRGNIEIDSEQRILKINGREQYNLHTLIMFNETFKCDGVNFVAL
jgi:hypothetical protein